MNKLLIKQRSGLGVARILRDAIQKQKLSPQQNVVELVFFRLPCGDGAIGRDKLIDRALDVFVIARIGGVQPHRIHAFQQRAQFVVPGPALTGGTRRPSGQRSIAAFAARSGQGRTSVRAAAHALPAIPDSNIKLT